MEVSELLASRALNQFQLTQPLMAGKRFFYYTLHYRNLLEQVQRLVSKVHTRNKFRVDAL